MASSNRENIPERLSDAVIELFSTHTYDDISINQIVEKAHVSKRTLYKYFPSKISLFVHVFEQHLQQIIDEDAGADFSQMDFRETLLSLFKSLYEFTNENQSFMRLFWMLTSQTVAGNLPEELMKKVLDLNQELMDRSVKRLSEKEPTGIYREMSPEMITQMYSAFNKGIFMQMTKENNIRVSSVSQKDLFEKCCRLLEYGTYQIRK